MEKPKCKDCPDRYVTQGSNCHATCDKYIQWNKRHKAELDRIRKIKDSERDIIDFFRGKIEKDYYKYSK